MALTIDSITRVQPAPCNHFEYTVTKSGVGSRSFIIHQDALDGLLEAAVGAFPVDIGNLPRGLQADLLTITIWAVWEMRRNGKTKAQVTGVDLEALL